MVVIAGVALLMVVLIVVGKRRKINNLLTSTRNREPASTRSDNSIDDDIPVYATIKPAPTICDDVPAKNLDCEKETEIESCEDIHGLNRQLHIQMVQNKNYESTSSENVTDEEDSSLYVTVYD